MHPDEGTAAGLAFARRMALGVGCCVATMALLLPFASFWGPFGALALRIGRWAIPLLLLLGGTLLAWEVALYLRAEWRAGGGGDNF